jgi:rare lipoprotein A
MGMIGWRGLLVAWVVAGSAGGTLAAPLSADAPSARQEAERLDKLPPVPPAPTGHIDHSGRQEKGRASFYARHFANHKMADGRRMNPNADVAARKNLPLGSVARVTNLENGKTATVTIEDRGPYVNGRVIDVTPKVAKQLDLGQKGVTPVAVKPITLPLPDGDVKLGAGAAEASPREVQKAVEVTKEMAPQVTTETAEK